MNIYVCTDHEGHYPVGVSSVIVAASEDEAHSLLIAELKTHGLTQRDPFTLRQISIDAPRAFVLQNGDY